jgi:hypothetical protein
LEQRDCGRDEFSSKCAYLHGEPLFDEYYADQELLIQTDLRDYFVATLPAKKVLFVHGLRG